MHGNRANVILYYNQTAISIFRSHLKTDLTLSLATLNHNIDFSEDFFPILILVKISFKRICRIYAPAIPPLVNWFGNTGI